MNVYGLGVTSPFVEMRYAIDKVKAILGKGEKE